MRYGRGRDVSKRRALLLTHRAALERAADPKSRPSYSVFHGLSAGIFKLNFRSLDHEIWSRTRSEEHTSELQSRGHLVCRLLLEKKKYILLKILHKLKKQKRK